MLRKDRETCTFINCKMCDCNHAGICIFKSNTILKHLNALVDVVVMTKSSVEGQTPPGAHNDPSQC